MAQRHDPSLIERRCAFETEPEQNKPARDITVLDARFVMRLAVRWQHDSAPRSEVSASMKITAVVAGIALFALSASAGVIGLTPGARPLAEGCIASTLLCGFTESGQLAAGDCTAPDGTRYDVWQFSGSIGQLVTINLQPLDASFTAPVLELIPPSGDPSVTPKASGAPPLSISYLLSSTGTWRIAVGTKDLAAAGRYSISMQCVTADFGIPKNCVVQTLSCNQAYRWSVSANSCRFSDAFNVYAPFSIRLAKNDRVHFSAHSDVYNPGIAIYKDGGNSLARNYGQRSTQDAGFDFTAPETYTYDVVVNGPPVHSPDVSPTGEFSMAVSCLSVCSPPVVTRQPASQSVPLGGTATLTVEGSVSNGNVPTYSWFEDDGSLPVSIATGATLTVRNVTRSRRFYARVENPCGSTNTLAVIVTPPLPRHRSAPH